MVVRGHSRGNILAAPDGLGSPAGSLDLRAVEARPFAPGNFEF